MYLSLAVFCTFGFTFASTNIEMEPLSKYNSTTLIRHANSKLDLRCRSSDSSAAELQLMHCISSRDCRNLTEVESLGSQVRVRFQSLQANDSGTYICLDHNTTEETYIILKVGVIPEPPEDFNCVSQDLKDLTCTWNKSKTQVSNSVPTKWNITIRWSVKGGSKFSDLVSCPNQTITNTSITCHWSCDNGRKYHVYLHGWNQLGNVSRIYNISPENYAMLSIQKLELVPSNISMSIVVQLHEHVFLSRVGKIVFQIEKRVLQDSESELTNLTQWITEIQENYEKNITDLKPFTRYEICIQTRLFEAIGHWSKPVCGKTVTKEGVPTHAPETTKWAYYFEKGSGRVRLYLKKIPSKYNTSKNYNYSILRLESGQVTSNITTKPNTTIEIPSNWIKGNDKITVRIRSCNDIGCSDPSTYVNIHKAKADFRPVGVTAMKDDGSDLYTVSCDIREKFRRNIRYTIFYYCRGFRESHTCLSDFNWINKNGAILRHTIKVPSGQYGDWMFGVSLVANDYTSGGISFASCYSSVNISCEDASIQKVESLTVIPDGVLTVVLIMVSLALIFVLLLLLRYSRQRYCQEFRIDLPEIFQKKYKNEEINSTLEDDFKLQMYTSYSSDNDTVDMVNKCQEERVNVKGRHDFVDGHHAEKSNADYEIISSKSSDAVHKIEEHPSLKSSLTDSGVTDLNNVVHTPTSNSSFEQIIKMASQESLNSVWAQNSDPSDEVIEMKLDLQKEVVEVDKFSDKGETDSLLPSGYAKITYMKCYACDDNMKHCEENECRELDRTAINLTPVCSANGCRCPEKVELISEYVT